MLNQEPPFPLAFLKLQNCHLSHTHTHIHMTLNWHSFHISSSDLYPSGADSNSRQLHRHAPKQLGVSVTLYLHYCKISAALCLFPLFFPSHRCICPPLPSFLHSHLQFTPFLLHPHIWMEQCTPLYLSLKEFNKASEALGCNIFVFFLWSVLSVLACKISHWC